MKRLRFLFACLLCLFMVQSVQAQHIEVLQQGRNSSLRGLSVVDNRIAWASGSKGTVAITTDGGKSWHWQQVKGFGQADFRDIEAFSDKEAIIMTSGTPALILKTTDGGISWREVYHNDDKAYFLDAMDFTPDGKHGFVLGDPIDGKFLLLETLDGGNTWAKFKYLPDALPGEAAFAASGTCLRVNNENIAFVTGGSKARCLTFSLRLSNAKISSNPNLWSYDFLHILQGQSSQGAFSISQTVLFTATSGAIVVGGDYSNPGFKESVSCSLYNHWDIESEVIKNGPAGYQSCVESLSKIAYLSTGTSGSNLTINGGQTWKQIDTTSFNVCRKAKNGSLVLLAGDNGRIALFKN